MHIHALLKGSPYCGHVVFEIDWYIACSCLAPVGAMEWKPSRTPYWPSGNIACQWIHICSALVLTSVRCCLRHMYQPARMPCSINDSNPGVKWRRSCDQAISGLMFFFTHIQWCWTKPCSTGSFIWWSIVCVFTMPTFSIPRSLCVTMGITKTGRSKCIFRIKNSKQGTSLTTKSFNCFEIVHMTIYAEGYSYCARPSSTVCARKMVRPQCAVLGQTITICRVDLRPRYHSRQQHKNDAIETG